MQSATGSGKTEALLAPCLERVLQSGRKEALIYIVPTRALAFDLQRRLDPIVKGRLGLRAAIRTGDIKRSGGGHPDLMLTTPESLDVLLGSPQPDLQAFVSRVRMIMIDEVHLFLHNYRGRQLACLLTRLERRCAARLQKMALSATIADTDTVIRFFGFQKDTVRCVAGVQREIVPHLVHLKNEEREFVALLEDLYQVWQYRKILIFANSRGKCDRLFALVNQSGRFRSACELHYSNLKTRERRAAERRFRKQRHAICIATSTLELGIDIGDVDGVLLYEPPDSITTFLQRIGRANRRGNRIHFWGICRGEKAGLQLLRFCGLLGPARKGAVEQPLPATLPSVLVQQVLSCVYEKKRISLPAMQDLFPAQQDTFETLFNVLIQQGWLESTHVRELFQGGWRYRRSLFEYKIWGNFPETEDNYTLELPGESVADLPWSIVRQLDPGDRVYVAGRRIQILHIDTGVRKRVLAQPATRLDDKKIVWLGTGAHVSHEVAQSMGTLLKTPDVTENGENFGLFSRTRKLLEMELQQAGRAATLENGIDVFMETDGCYHYRTFLGSIGNLILQYTIQSDWGKTLEDLYITSSEIGLVCSHRIDFSRLNLPLNREAFAAWTAGHLKILRALFSLNTFCSALPRPLLIEELTDFIFDPRLAESFHNYRRKSSKIVSGTLETIAPDTEENIPQITFLETPVPTESLLEWEKQRWGIASQEKETSAAAGNEMPLESVAEAGPRNRPAQRHLTGTLIGKYIRHQQCERYVRFQFLPPEAQPPRRTRVDNDLSLQRIEQGRQFEDRVLTYLERHSRKMVSIREQDKQGRPRSLKERFKETCNRLEELVHNAPTASGEPLYLSQGVLLLESVLRPGHPEGNAIDGIGIPDLIRISFDNQGAVLQIGDIKHSRLPRYDQKWQVAFYAWLLHRLINAGRIPIQARVARRGFLLTPPPIACGNRPQDTESNSEVAPQEHEFDPVPYMAAFPVLFENLTGPLERPVSACAWQLQSHCTTCDWFECCYRQALKTDDIQFLPQLTLGELSKIRTLQLNTLPAAHAWFETNGKASDPKQSLFSPQQADRLQRRLTALTTHRIALHKHSTPLIPAHMSTTIVVHGMRDPLSSRPCAVGWRLMDAAGNVLETCTLEMRTEVQREASWLDFSARFSSLWQRRNGRGDEPHVFYFGGGSRQILQDWATAMEDPASSTIWGRLPAHWTDLRQLIVRHFDLPIPGPLTLFALSRILGLEPEARPPESLFHRDMGGMSETDESYPTLSHLDDTLLRMDRLRQWALQHLESDGYPYEEDHLNEASTPQASAYLDFIDTERDYKEADIRSLQACPLAERVARFRSLGPLKFQDTTLDDEGGFLYQFRFEREIGLSKFREGDFLKLAPAGLTDLQSGFSVILAQHDHQEGYLAVRSRQGRIALNRRMAYSLEEDMTDWNDPKLKHVVSHVFDEIEQPLAGLLEGRCRNREPIERLEWIEDQLQTFAPLSQLNATQQQALQLPFTFRMSLIEGPPGTGKTFLAGWILISLIRQAHDAGRPLRIAVSALTHQAIDNVLRKVVQLVNAYQIEEFPARCIKFGRWESPQNEEEDIARVESSSSQTDIMSSPYLILGATGYGLYQLLEGRRGTFPEVFDWVVFDEASQILVPQALLSLIYGKGQFLFLGDVQQLPPIVLGNYEDEGVRHSILQRLMERYPATQRIRLDVTYRMNEDLCRFPSRMWYDGMLHPAPENADIRLARYPLQDNPSTEIHPKDIAHQASTPDHLLDEILDPEKPVALVLSDHQGCHQVSMPEAELMAQLAFRLMTGFGLHPDQLALISPHRAQNNAIAQRLGELLEATGTPLPLIDTVERMQGAERDVILFAFTTSDPDHTAGEFLNNPNRFNVAITRARRKLIVIGSRAFFSTIPPTEKGLEANACFKEFLRYCREMDSVFYMSG